MNDLGWAFWEDAIEVPMDDGDGSRLFAKDGWLCYCPLGVNPGDQDSVVSRDPR